MTTEKQNNINEFRKANPERQVLARMARSFSRSISLPYLFFLSLVTLLIAMFALLATPASAFQIKDIASIKGVRIHQSAGYVLAVDLDATGDGNKSAFTIKSMVSMLEKMGVTVNADDIEDKNVAADMVPADLPLPTPVNKE